MKTTTKPRVEREHIRESVYVGLDPRSLNSRFAKVDCEVEYQLVKATNFSRTYEARRSSTGQLICKVTKHTSTEAPRWTAKVPGKSNLRGESAYGESTRRAAVARMLAFKSQRRKTS